MILRALTLFVAATISYSTVVEAKKVRFQFDNSRMGLTSQQIHVDVDIAGQNPRQRTIDIVGSMEYFEMLKEQGFPVRLLEEQINGVDQSYLDPKEIRLIIRQLKEEHPDIVHVVQIGESLMKQPIYGVRISTPTNVEFKPTILFNGMHHAREIMTTEVTVDIMLYLVKNFNNPETPWVNQWLDNLAIWVVPQLNPDGNSIVWEMDNWWRKNARNDGGQPWGVDLNRNYPYDWAKCNGSSGSKSSQTYRGDSAGSEPETQALMKIVRDQNIALNISYHSYSELVIAPYGCQGKHTPENFIVADIGSKLAKKLVTDDGRGTYQYGTGWEILYPVDGDDISWMYHEANTISYVVEVNGTSQGFQPDYKKWRNITVKNQRAGWQYLLNRAMAGPQLRGRMLDAKTGKSVDGEIRIISDQVDYKNEKPRRAKNGVFYKMLMPGEYEFEFRAEGYLPQTLAVSVGESPVVENIQLEPASLFE